MHLHIHTHTQTQIEWQFSHPHVKCVFQSCPHMFICIWKSLISSEMFTSIFHTCTLQTGCCLTTEGTCCALNCQPTLETHLLGFKVWLKFFLPLKIPKCFLAALLLKVFLFVCLRVLILSVTELIIIVQGMSQLCFRPLLDCKNLEPCARENQCTITHQQSNIH